MKAKSAADQSMFSNLAKLLQCILLTAFSNASVERVVSQLKLSKNDHMTAFEK